MCEVSRGARRLPCTSLWWDNFALFQSRKLNRAPANVPHQPILNPMMMAMQRQPSRTFAVSLLLAPIIEFTLCLTVWKCIWCNAIFLRWSATLTRQRSWLPRPAQDTEECDMYQPLVGRPLPMHSLVVSSTLVPLDCGIGMAGQHSTLVDRWCKRRWSGDNRPRPVR